MTRKKLLLPILTVLPLFFMAAAPTPPSHYEYPLNNFYENVEAEFEDITGSEDEQNTYRVSIKNTGTEYATVFSVLGDEFLMHYRNRKFGLIEAPRFETSLFYNEVILPGATCTYTIKPLKTLYNLPEKDALYSQSFYENHFMGNAIGLNLTPFEGVENKYLINGVTNDDYFKTSTYVVIEATYDGNSYAFFSILSNNKFTIDVFEELDLEKFSITKASFYETIIAERNTGYNPIGMLVILFLMAAEWLAVIGAIVAAVIIFIIAPAIVIPILVTRGKKRAQEKEKRAESVNNDFGIDGENVHPEDFDDINKIE